MRIRGRDHAQDAKCRDLLERLYAEAAAIGYIGGLRDGEETLWSAPENGILTHSSVRVNSGDRQS